MMDASRIQKGDEVVVSIPSGLSIKKVDRVSGGAIYIGNRGFSRETGVCFLNEDICIVEPSDDVMDVLLRQRIRSTLCQRLSNIKWSTLSIEKLDRVLSVVEA